MNVAGTSQTGRVSRIVTAALTGAGTLFTTAADEYAIATFGANGVGTYSINGVGGFGQAAAATSGYTTYIGPGCAVVWASGDVRCSAIICKTA